MRKFIAVAVLLSGSGLLAQAQSGVQLIQPDGFTAMDTTRKVHCRGSPGFLTISQAGIGLYPVRGEFSCESSLR